MRGATVLKLPEGPLLERLREDGVVGVGHHAAHHRDGLVKLEAVNVHEQAHQLGDDHRGVRVVDLHHGVVGQVVQVGATLHCLVEDELRRVGDHEVLLVYAEQAAGVVGVVGVEEEREVLGELALVEVDGVHRHQRVIDALEVKQAQAVLGRAHVAQNVDVIEGATSPRSRQTPRCRPSRPSRASPGGPASHRARRPAAGQQSAGGRDRSGS